MEIFLRAMAGAVAGYLIMVLIEPRVLAWTYRRRVRKWKRAEGFTEPTPRGRSRHG